MVYQSFNLFIFIMRSNAIPASARSTFFTSEQLSINESTLISAWN